MFLLAWANTIKFNRLSLPHHHHRSLLSECEVAIGDLRRSCSSFDLFSAWGADNV